MTLLEELLKVRRDIAALEATELALMQDIIDATGHRKIGSATYDLDGHKVTIETKENTTLDKALLNQVWSEELPINRAYAYTLRKKDFDAAMTHGTPAVKKLLASIVTTKPARPAVRIGD
jgi:hypothetical protein